MTIEEVIKSKELKPKEKTETISAWILDGSLPIEELTAFAEKAKDPALGTCVEVLEYVTKQNPGIADENLLAFVTENLYKKAPRVKWESARVIGNIAHLFPSKLEKPIAGLLENSVHEGTVVRWSSAFALSEIIKLKTQHNCSLIPEAEKIYAQEEKNSIRKIYADAIKKAGK